jgi:hypothetical protein
MGNAAVVPSRAEPREHRRPLGGLISLARVQRGKLSEGHKENGHQGKPWWPV